MITESQKEDWKNVAICPAVVIISVESQKEDWKLMASP